MAEYCSRTEETNIHIHDGVDMDAFVELRQARDKTLPTPVLMLPSIQINVRAGAFLRQKRMGSVI